VTPELKAELGITDGLLRLSIGLEAPEDLMRDIDRALSALKV
jgi:cystathionine beta-lyase/cystathionine gamma-synthase